MVGWISFKSAGDSCILGPLIAAFVSSFMWLSVSGLHPFFPLRQTLNISCWTAEGSLLFLSVRKLLFFPLEGWLHRLLNAAGVSILLAFEYFSPLSLARFLHRVLGLACYRQRVFSTLSFFQHLL